jgi:iron complex transport system substrate-binding protein
MTNFHWRLPTTLIFGFFVSLMSSSLSRAGCVEDEAGRKVRVPQELRRIVALAPSIAECLFALGLDDEVVGVTEFSNYPPEVLSRPQVGSYVQINLESVLALEPDLVIATRDGNPKQVVDRLTEMGLAVYVVDPRHMEGLFRTLQVLGQLLDREDKAQTLVRELRGRLDEIQRLLKGTRRPRVFLQIGIDPLVTVGRGTLQDELIRLAGGVNIAEEEPVPYPVMSVEHILRARPEVIIVSSMTGGTSAEQELQRWHQWEMIPAVARGRFHVINGDLIDRPTPRLLDGLEEMVRLIHPDLSSQIRGSRTE